MINNQQIKQKNKERSIAYPSITLEAAVELSSKLLDSLGKGPYSREEAARGIGHSTLTGPSARKVAALVHYGLLERKGNAYSLSHLAQDILIPISEDQKKVSIIQAVQNPRLFGSLIQRYQGQSLPVMLGSILVRDKIGHSVAEEVANIFRESLQFSGLLQNGVLISNLNTPSEQQNSEDQVTQQEIVSPKPPILPKALSDNFVFDFAGGIKLVIPKNQRSSEAIADGELKNVRKAISEIAHKFVGDPNEQSNINE